MSIIEVLTQAAAEIRSLRRQNELLAAKVEMIDLFACVLHTQAARIIEGAAPDIAWALDNKVREL